MDLPARLTLRQAAWFLAFFVCWQWAGIDGAVVSPRVSVILKQDLHRSAEDLARFGQALSAAGAFSVLYGYVRDRLPWGDRRLLLFETPVCVLIPLFLLRREPTFDCLLACMVLATVSTGMMTASFNGTLSTMGRRLGATGRLTGLLTAVGALVAAAGEEIGGALGSLRFSVTLSLVALVGMLLFALLLRPAEGAFPLTEQDDREAVDSGETVTPLRAVSRLVRCGPFLVAVLYRLIWNFSPAYGTPLTVRLQEVAGFRTQEFGHYGAIANLVGVFGGLAFAALVVRFSPRAILTWGPLVYLPTVFLLFVVRTPPEAYAMIGVTCLVSSALNAATFALVLRTVPAGLEGTGIALSASVGALLGGQGDVWATTFTEHHGFFATVWVSIVLVFVLPPFARLLPSLPPEGRPA